MNRILALTMTAIATFAAVAHADEWRPLDKEIDALKALVSDGYAQEYRGARHVLYPNEQRHYALVLFTLEGQGGGNNYIFYMAKFTPHWADENIPYDEFGDPQNVSLYSLDALTPVGGKFVAGLNFAKTTADDEHITLYGNAYGEGDGACCPSVPFVRHYNPATLTKESEQPGTTTTQ